MLDEENGGPAGMLAERSGAEYSGGSPEATRESRMLTCTRPRVAPFGLPAAVFRAAALAAWFPRRSADDRLQCAGGTDFYYRRTARRSVPTAVVGRGVGGSRPLSRFSCLAHGFLSFSTSGFPSDFFSSPPCRRPTFFTSWASWSVSSSSRPSSALISSMVGSLVS